MVRIGGSVVPGNESKMLGKVFSELTKCLECWEILKYYSVFIHKLPFKTGKQMYVMKESKAELFL